MSVLIRGAKMPPDCPMCPMAHFDAAGLFRGCEIVPGKKHAMQDPLYAQSSSRPDWCPLVEIPAHGRLIDADALAAHDNEDFDRSFAKDDATVQWVHMFIQNRIAYAPTIIPAEDKP